MIKDTWASYSEGLHLVYAQGVNRASTFEVFIGGKLTAVLLVNALAMHANETVEGCAWRTAYELFPRIAK